MTGALKGLLVDYGGVLTTPMTQSFKAFCLHIGLDREVLKETFTEARASPNGPIHQVETGTLTGQEFAVRLAEAVERKTGTALEPAEFLDGLLAGVKPLERMLGAVEAARAAGVATGLLSNSWGGREQYPYERFDTLFDAVVISGEVGLRKPDPTIYRLAAGQLGLPPAPVRVRRRSRGQHRRGGGGWHDGHPPRVAG
jgi:putative hydrolase of the HAD superfamily